MAAVLGTTIEFVADARLRVNRWVISDGPGPQLSWDADTRTLTSFATDEQQFRATLNLLHTLAWSDRTTVTADPEPTAERAVDRIASEIANCFPGLELRGLDWEQITAAHAFLRTETGDDFAIGAQRWIARLGDAHTAVRWSGPRHNPPYRGRLDDAGVTLFEVPAWSQAHAAGVRAGWRVDVDDPRRWLTTTGATPQQHSQVAARRFLTMYTDERSFLARDGHGRAVTWIETIAPTPDTATLQYTRHDDGRHLVRLRAFDPALKLDEAFTDIFDQARNATELILDLRGNTGGSLAAATRLRDRFLREATPIGWIRFTSGTGRLSDLTPRTAEPSDLPRWRRNLTVLVDAMTYSAAEDFLLGLQGLDHVRVVGEPTGGGSGRPRTITLTDNLELTISTALTYDRTGRCIEHNGIPVDIRT